MPQAQAPDSGTARHTTGPVRTNLDPATTEAPSPETLELIERLQSSHLPLRLRLDNLRDRARQGARNATWLATVSSLVILLILITYIYLALLTFGAADPVRDQLMLQIVGIVGILVALRGLVPAVAGTFSAWRLYAYYYREACAYLVFSDEALLYVNDDYALELGQLRRRLSAFVVADRP